MPLSDHDSISYPYQFDEHERKRLLSLSKVFEEMTRSTLSALIKPGMKVADIGCGPGATTRMLSEMVTETGLVVALDHCYKYIEDINDLKLANVVAYPGTVSIDGTMPEVMQEHEFDIIFSRAFLWFFPDAQPLLSSYKKLLKPGGKVVCRECCKPFSSNPHLKVISVLLQKFPNLYVGATLPAKLRNEGLIVLSEREERIHFHNKDCAAYEWFDQNLRTTYVQSAISTEAMKEWVDFSNGLFDCTVFFPEMKIVTAAKLNND